MITLEEVTEQNWLAVRRLAVREEQRGFLDNAVGILARGYVYRNCRSRVFAVTHDGSPVGLALVRDLDEEPACYELQQFMIDACFQNRGFGTAALTRILSLLREEGKYPCAEVCVRDDDAPALHLYEKLGFADTGYVDETAPGCRNLRFCFENEPRPRKTGGFPEKSGRKH